MQAQYNDNLRKLWELSKIERLGSVMFGTGEEIKKMDLRHPTRIIFGNGSDYDSITYKVVGEDIELFDKDNNVLTKDVAWRIEQLTTDELSLLYIIKAEQKTLLRLKYRAMD
jgi:hypothetical protein